VSLQQLIELLALSNLELSSRSMLVVNTKNDIHVLHRLSLDVRERLDLGRRVLDLLIRHLELELLDSRLDSVPSGETVTEEREKEGGEEMVRFGAWADEGRGGDVGWLGKRRGKRKTRTHPIETYRVIPKSSGFRIS